MWNSTRLGFLVMCSSALIACSRDAHAEVPKPPAGGRAFDVELVEAGAPGVRGTRHFVLTLTGERECARLAAHRPNDGVDVSVCLTESGGKAEVALEVGRSRGDGTTKIEGRVPVAEGSRILVGRVDHDAERLEVYVTLRSG